MSEKNDKHLISVFTVYTNNTKQDIQTRLYFPKHFTCLQEAINSVT